MDNSRFKFRAWNGKKMIYFDLDELIENNSRASTISPRYNNDLLDFRNYNSSLNDVMQSTGRKDKNVKLIYEGDIVGDYFGQHNGNDVISKDSERIVVWDDEKVGFNLDGDENYLILGNIYETPELLNSPQ